MLVWSLSLYNTIEFKVSFFYAKSRTCSFIDKKIDKEKEYSILLTDTTMSVLKKINPKCEIEQLKDTTLSSAWTEAMSNGQQPSAPEDYIEVEQ